MLNSSWALSALRRAYLTCGSTTNRRNPDAREFGATETEWTAAMYRHMKHTRGRDMDLAIAASATQHRARLAESNDFRD